MAQFLLHASFWIKRVNADAKFELLDLKVIVTDKLGLEDLRQFAPKSCKRMLVVEKKLPRAQAKL